MEHSQERFLIDFSVIYDKYQVRWITYLEDAYRAAEWCNESFGPEWGTLQWRDIARDGVSINYFKFHRISHAQWFILKWKPE